MSEHTPGPWTADPQHDPLRPWEFHIYAGLEESDEGYNGGHIATATGGDPDINKANARLIAAAPEMLEFISSWAAVRTCDLCNESSSIYQGHAIKQGAMICIHVAARALLARLEG